MTLHLGHATHRESLGKFILLLAVVGSYFGYLSWKFDAATGGAIAALSWAFFVLCTPIADAGFLLDFPIRLLFKVRMVFTEIAVWVLAFSISAWGVFYAPDLFGKTIITSLFYQILTTPYPFWGLIVLCAFGTFLSIHFGDEMLDVFAHRDRHRFHEHGAWLRLVGFLAVIIIVVIAYHHLVSQLGLTLPV